MVNNKIKRNKRKLKKDLKNMLKTQIILTKICNNNYFYIYKLFKIWKINLKKPTNVYELRISKYFEIV